MRCSETARVLHPSFADGRAGRVGRSFAPFLDDPALVEPIWRRLAERAGRLGLTLPEPPAITEDPGLSVQAGKRVFRPLSGRNGTYTFALPALTDGWWAREADGASLWRWTNGDALLPVRLTEPAILEVVTSGGAIYA